MYSRRHTPVERHPLTYRRHASAGLKTNPSALRDDPGWEGECIHAVDVHSSVQHGDFPEIVAPVEAAQVDGLSYILASVRLCEYSFPTTVLWVGTPGSSAQGLLEEMKSHPDVASPTYDRWRGEPIPSVRLLDGGHLTVTGNGKSTAITATCGGLLCVPTGSPARLTDVSSILQKAYPGPGTEIQAVPAVPQYKPYKRTRTGTY